MTIDFDQINRTALSALASLVAEWLPAGARRGNEWVVGDLQGSAGDSLSINVATGVWRDFAAEVGGSDPISLLAALRQIGQAEAATELAKKLGVNGFAGGAAARGAKEAWLPILPAPADAPAASLGDADACWTYRSAAGAVLFHVRRFNKPGGKKDFFPLTFGVLEGRRGWHARHPASPRPLFRLDELAARADAPVVVCEGEKSAEAAGRLLPARVAVTWPAGSGAVKQADWSALAGRDVLVWPDADAAGAKAAALIVAALAPIARSVAALELPPETSAKWDAADAEAEGWDPRRAEGWIAELLARGREAALVGGDELPRAPEIDPDPDDGGRGGPVPLGFDRALYYYLSRADGQVHALSAAQHGKMNLMALASLAHYWERTRFRGPNGISWDKAADWLMQCARDRGVFDPLLIRGRGAWLDDGRVVLHQGDVLVVDGEPVELGGIRSAFVYERRYPLRRPATEAADATEASKLLDLCCQLSWSGRGDASEVQPLAGYLLAGWCAIAPVCGALRWRPSIWITGPSGSGKGWVIDNILRRCLDGIATAIEGDTTDKGIEQHLRGDARPIIFDEAEQDGQRAIDRLQNILFLVRVSSSSSGGLQLKGTADGRGRSTQIRTCFAFASINPGMKQYADETRVTMLPLDRGDDPAAFEEIKRAARELFRGDFVDRLLARVHQLLPVILANLEVFSDAATALFGSRRNGDQIAALLAGAYALRSSRRVDLAAASEWIGARQWQDVTAINAETDETRLLRTICEYTVKISRETGGILDRTIGDLLSAVRFTTDERLSSADARQHLSRFGIRPEADFVLISNTHTMLRDRVLRGTPWSAALRTALLRLPGATAFPRSVRFGSGPPTKAVQVPWELFGGNAMT